MGEKSKALEQVGELVVGPLPNALHKQRVWKMLVAPDHPTPISTTAHDATPPPFCFAGHAVEAVEKRPFSEKDAVGGGFMIDPGHELMGLFLRS